MDWEVADLEQWGKAYEKVKSTMKVINTAIITERERSRYFDEFGRFPQEFPEGSEGHKQWTNGRERTKYVKELTERNETSTAKKPSRAKKTKAAAKPGKWVPPPH